MDPQDADIEMVRYDRLSQPEESTTMAPTIEQANRRLPAPEREVLAFLQGGFSYQEIATLIGLDVSDVSELIVVARLRLHDVLTGGDRAPDVYLRRSCLPALAVASARSDGEMSSGSDADMAHVTRCTPCIGDLGAALAAAEQYRSWAPAAPGAAFREATLVRASALLPIDRAGADL